MSMIRLMISMIRLMININICNLTTATFSMQNIQQLYKEIGIGISALFLIVKEREGGMAGMREQREPRFGFKLGCEKDYIMFIFSPRIIIYVS